MNKIYLQIPQLKYKEIYGIVFVVIFLAYSFWEKNNLNKLKKLNNLVAFFIINFQV